MMGIGTALDPFTVRLSYKAVEHLPIEEQRKRLRDPELREDAGRSRRIRSKTLPVRSSHQPLGQTFTMGNPPDYEPGPDESVVAICRDGRTPDEVAYDYIIEESQYCLPGGQLRDGRSSADPRNARRPLAARPERRRRALHLDRGFRPAEFHARAWGARSPPAPTAALEHLSSGKPARPPTSSVCPTAAGWCRACGPT